MLSWGCLAGGGGGQEGTVEGCWRGEAGVQNMWQPGSRAAFFLAGTFYEKM